MAACSVSLLRSATRIALDFPAVWPRPRTAGFADAPGARVELPGLVLLPSTPPPTGIEGVPSVFNAGRDCAHGGWKPNTSRTGSRLAESVCQPYAGHFRRPRAGWGQLCNIPHAKELSQLAVLAGGRPMHTVSFVSSPPKGSTAQPFENGLTISVRPSKQGFVDLGTPTSSDALQVRWHPSVSRRACLLGRRPIGVGPDVP